MAAVKKNEKLLIQIVHFKIREPNYLLTMKGLLSESLVTKIYLLENNAIFGGTMNKNLYSYHILLANRITYKGTK